MSVETLQILDIIKRLPLSEKLKVVELIFKSIKEETINKESEIERRIAAAERLLSDYQNDDELTAFSILDHEDFYEEK